MNYFIRNKDKFLKSIEERNCSNLIEVFKNCLIDIENKKKLELELSNLNKIKNLINKNSVTEDASSIKERRRMVRENIAIIKKNLDENLIKIPNIVDDDLPKQEPRLEKKFGIFQESASFPRCEEQIIEECPDAFKRERKFCFLYGRIAKIYRMIELFMALRAEKNFEEVYCPLISKREAGFKSGHLPKFEEDMFFIEGYDGMLIPTSEMAILEFLSGMKLEKNRRLFARTECFRKEVGSIAKDNLAIKRMHQFTKIELFSVCEPKDSKEEHEFITSQAEKVLEQLEIPYRRILLHAADTGFSSSKTFDIEAWLPASKVFLEVSSSSNCLEFQSLKANIKIKDEYAHTLNASGLAVGRVMMAMLENFGASGSLRLLENLLSPWTGLEPVT